MKQLIEAIDSLILLRIHQATRKDNLTDGQAISDQKDSLVKLLESTFKLKKLKKKAK